MRVLMVGDICGSPGRQAAARHIPALRKKYEIDFVVANGENAAAGSGLTRKVLDELQRMEIDVITSGNHIWDKKEVFQFIDDEPYLVRPANYPPGTPGKGYCVFPWKEKKVGIINLSGRSFMPPMDCPFRAADALLAKLDHQCDLILLDFHAETTSEKMAMGWYLDGKITCLVGTHTHIQTADERILPKGTAYITDLGMVGPWNSVLGVDKDLVLKKFRTALPVRFEIAEAPNVFCGVVLSIDDASNRVQEITRIMLREE